MKILMILLTGFYFLACVRAGKPEGRQVVHMKINHYKVPCVGAGAQLCYLARTDDESQWEFLFEGISGFEYQWGKVYELEVEKSKRSDTKADQSPIVYTLVRIINSKDAPVDEPFALIIKDPDIIAVRKDAEGHFGLLGQYPISCISASLCQDLEERLRMQPNITGLFQHSLDRQSLVLQSFKN